MFALNSALNCDNREGLDAPSGTPCYDRQNAHSLRTLKEPKNGPLGHFRIAKSNSHLQLLQEFKSKDSREMRTPPRGTAVKLREIRVSLGLVSFSHIRLRNTVQAGSRCQSELAEDNAVLAHYRSMGQECEKET